MNTKVTTEIDAILIKLSSLIKEGSYKYQYKGSKIQISSQHYYLEIFQQEHYDERLSCTINFYGCEIIFEHLYEAIEKRKFIFYGTNANHEEFNAHYLTSIFEFFKNNIIVINEFPPGWFLEAVAISSCAYATSFPSVAERYKNEAMKLWISWQEAESKNNHQH